MRKLFLIAGIVGAIAFVYFLYQRQLGSIGFLLLSIYFFSLAINQLTKQSINSTEENEKDSSKFN